MNYKTVTIPARDEHDGIWSRIVTLRWVCPICGGQRGEPFESVSYDGSRRLHVHSWHNPCGHVDKYSSVRQEADAMNAELPSSSLYPHRFNADVYSEGHPSDELPAYRDEAFEAEQRAMTPADYDIPAPPVSPIAVVRQEPYQVGDECRIGPRKSQDIAWFTPAIVTEVLRSGSRVLKGKNNNITYSLSVDFLYPIVEDASAKDARIARLEQELLGLNMAYDIEMERANELGKAYGALALQAAVMGQAEREAATNEGYEAGKEEVGAALKVTSTLVDTLTLRIATLEARLAKIDAAFDECAKLAERELLHEEYMRLWGIRLEQLFATVAQSKPQDHAEIAARQADDNDNRSAGEGIYF